MCAHLQVAAPRAARPPAAGRASSPDHRGLGGAGGAERSRRPPGIMMLTGAALGTGEAPVGSSVSIRRHRERAGRILSLLSHEGGTRRAEGRCWKLCATAQALRQGRQFCRFGRPEVTLPRGPRVISRCGVAMDRRKVAAPTESPHSRAAPTLHGPRQPQAAAASSCPRAPPVLPAPPPPRRRWSAPRLQVPPGPGEQRAASVETLEPRLASAALVPECGMRPTPGTPIPGRPEHPPTLRSLPCRRSSSSRDGAHRPVAFGSRKPSAPALQSAWTRSRRTCGRCSHSSTPCGPSARICRTADLTSTPPCAMPRGVSAMGARNPGPQGPNDD